MKQTKLALIYLVIALAISCTGGGNSKKTQKVEIKTKKTVAKKPEYPITIDVAGSLDNKKTVKLSEIAESIEYIPLETNSKSLFGNIMCFSVTENYIFVRGYGGSILQFTRKGKFVKKIGRVGKGPGEFCQYARFDVDKQNKLITVYNYHKNKFHYYNFEGKHLYDINSHRGDFENFSVINKIPVLSYGIHYGIQDYRLLTFNKDGSFIDKKVNHEKFKKREMTYSISSGFDTYMHKYGNSVLYKGQYEDTVLQISSSGKFTPRYIIDHGKYKLPLEKRVEYIGNPKEFFSAAKGYFKTKILETDKYLFISKLDYKNRSKSDCGICKKSDYRQYFLENDKGEPSELINNIDEGPDFYPYFIVNKNCVGTYIRAHHLLEYIKERKEVTPATNPEAKKKFDTLIKNLKEGDNPVFIIVKLK